MNAGFLQSVCQLRTCAAGRCIGFDSCKTPFRRSQAWGLRRFRSYQKCCRLGCMDAKLIIPVMGGAGEDFREKPRLDNVLQRWGQWVCQLSRFDSCKTLFRRHRIWGIWGFRSYQMCGHRCRICSKWGCGRSGFVYRVNSTSSKLTNPMIRFLQMGLGRETPLSTFAVGSGCRCSKRGFWLG